MKFTAVALFSAAAVMAMNPLDLVPRADGDYTIDIAPHIKDECKDKCHIIVDLYNDLTAGKCKPFEENDECIKLGCAAVEESFTCAECQVNATSFEYKALAAIAVVRGKDFAENYCKGKNFPTNK